MHEDGAPFIFGLLSFLQCAQRKLLEALGLEAAKAWYPHYFHTEEKL